MTKVIAPLLSLEAHGRLGGVLVYKETPNGSTVSELVPVGILPSPEQSQVRALYRFLVQKWQLMPEEIKILWDNEKSKNGYSGYHAFMSQKARDLIAGETYWDNPGAFPHTLWGFDCFGDRDWRNFFSLIQGLATCEHEELTLLPAGGGIRIDAINRPPAKWMHIIHNQTAIERNLNITIWAPGTGEEVQILMGENILYMLGKRNGITLEESFNVLGYQTEFEVYVINNLIVYQPQQGNAISFPLNQVAIQNPHIVTFSTSAERLSFFKIEFNNSQVLS